jgi:hypothetical protein
MSFLIFSTFFLRYRKNVHDHFKLSIQFVLTICHVMLDDNVFLILSFVDAHLGATSVYLNYEKILVLFMFSFLVLQKKLQLSIV